MSISAKLLAVLAAPNAQAAGTVIGSQGVNTVPASYHWICTVEIYNSESSPRTVTAGWHPSDAALVAGEYLVNAESFAAKERRKYGPMIVPSGYVFRFAEGNAAAGVQARIEGYEESN